MSYPPIENHGLIGDLETTALVCNDGTINFMCFPDFDSPTVFASLLDSEKGGFFRVAPVGEDFDRRQSYRSNTNILDTTFRSPDALAIVTDFMTMNRPNDLRSLVRCVKTIRGDISFRAVCAPRFDYGTSAHKAEKKRKGILFIPDKMSLPPMLLRANVPLESICGDAQSQFRLRAGQSAWFVFEEFASDLNPLNLRWILEAMEKTRSYWEAWIARCTYRGRWREMVNRSALALALLMSKRDGSIIAAPTFGLPEWPGADQNWDYRFTWVRDASFALDAFLQIGYTEEASAIMGWLEKRCSQFTANKPLQVVYRSNGDRRLPERELKHFEGYKSSRPVRIGNAACDQLQLDIYGELIDSVFLYDQYTGAVSLKFWKHICRILDWICQNWQRSDDSIWELRGRARPYLYSRAKCWRALDRAIKMAEARSFPAPLNRWRKVMDRISKEILSSFWNPRLKSFVQYRGANILDASLLVLPRVNLIDSSHPRWRLTLKAMEKYLVEDCFVYRYRPATPATKEYKAREGTFSACTFWYLNALADANELVKAQAIFEKFLGYANELGLYSEQLGPQGEHLGNFPQALSHISLIRAACNLDEKLSRAGSIQKPSPFGE